MAKNKLITLLLAIIVFVSTSSCGTDITITLPQLPAIPSLDLGGSKGIVGSGTVAKETRILRNIDSVTVSGGANLVITQGNEEGLEIEAEDNLIQFFHVEVKGANLTLDSNPNSELSATEPVNFYLKVKNLGSLTMNGSGNAQSESIKSDQFTMALEGSGDIKITKFRANSLTVSLPGSGDIRLGGSVVDQTVTLDGSGNYFTKGLASVNAKVNVSGSGSVEVQCKEKLDVKVDGSGLVRYSGNPKVTKTISGSGGVERITK
jgi:hypothetical protein